MVKVEPPPALQMASMFLVLAAIIALEVWWLLRMRKHRRLCPDCQAEEDAKKG